VHKIDQRKIDNFSYKIQKDWESKYKSSFVNSFMNLIPFDDSFLNVLFVLYTAYVSFQCMHLQHITVLLREKHTSMISQQNQVPMFQCCGIH